MSTSAPVVCSTRFDAVAAAAGLVWRCLALMAAAAVCLLLAARVFLGFNYQTVLTSSMLPDHPPGSVLVTREMPVSSLRVGQIAVFVPPGHTAPVSHRIIAITGDPSAPTVRTKGDANDAADPWTSHLTRSAVPVVVASVPWIGKGLTAIHLRNPATEALLVAAFGLLVTVAYMRRMLRQGSSVPEPGDGFIGPVRPRTPCAPGTCCRPGGGRRDPDGSYTHAVTRHLTHVELLYRPGEREQAIAVLDLLGCEPFDRGGHWFTAFVDPAAEGPRNYADNVLYASEVTPAQWALEQALGTGLAADREELCGAHAERSAAFGALRHPGARAFCVGRCARPASQRPVPATRSCAGVSPWTGCSSPTRPAPSRRRWCRRSSGPTS